MQRTIFLLGFFVVLFSNEIFAQDSTQTSPIIFSGYVETYYAYDFRQPKSNELPFFVYNHKRHNEVNINLAFGKVAYNTGKIRSNLALMAGTYAQYNMANELPLLQHIFEANAGLKISEKHNLWIDAGVMPSHIGFETAIGIDNWTLTRSILADNSPYYESGVKLGYTSKNEKWYMAAMFLNGWQRITRNSGNTTPAFATQITYTSTNKNNYNWSTFVGNEFDGRALRMRYFNNFYSQINITKKLSMIRGLDFGFQENGKNGYHFWYAAALITRYKLNDKMRVALRGEYYNDKYGVIVSNKFNVMGISSNFDYIPFKNAVIRIETKYFGSRDRIFRYLSNIRKNDLILTSSFIVSF
jgi:hypothetical protein